METADVSRRGVFIRTAEPLDANKIAQLRLTMPTGRELDAMGHVRRVVREPPGAEHGMGIEFFVMSKEAEEEWDRFVLAQSRNASGVSSMLVAVDVTQQPSGNANVAGAMVELPVVRESVEALLPEARRTSSMVNEPTVVATGADARGAMVTKRGAPDRPPLIPTAQPAARDERSMLLADVHAETFPALELDDLWKDRSNGTAGLLADPGPQVQPPLPLESSLFEEDDVPWATPRPAASAIEPVRTNSITAAAKLAPAAVTTPDDEGEEAVVLSRSGMAGSLDGANRAGGSRARSAIRNAGINIQRPNVSNEPAQPARRNDDGPDGAFARDAVATAGQERTPAPRAAGTAVANAKPRPNAIQGPTIATGSPITAPATGRGGPGLPPSAGPGVAARRTTSQPPVSAPSSPARPAATSKPAGAPTPTPTPTPRPDGHRTQSVSSPSSPRSQQPRTAEVDMAQSDGGGIFITVRPGDVGHLRQFVDRRIRQANVFLRSMVSCAPGQPFDVAVVHPITDAEVIVSGTVARVIRGETAAESGFLLRFGELDEHLQASLMQFVETGHPEVRAPTAVTANEQQDLRKAAEQEASTSDAWLLYGWSLLSESEDPLEAIEAFQRALMMSPERAGIHDGLALAYALAGETAKSYAFLRSSRQLAQAPKP